MTNPYTKAARVLDDSTGKRKAPTGKAAAPAKAETSMHVVGKKYMDPQSRSDEAYMTGAQQRINKRLAGAGERMSEELRTAKRKGFGLKMRRGQN